MSILIGVTAIGYFVDQYLVHSFLLFFIVAIALNAFLLLLSRRPIKRIARGLTVDEVAVPVQV
jgi:amino acid transporter